MIQSALQGQDITLYGNGRYIRDYVYISDVVDAFLAAPTHIKSTSGKHFFIASGLGISLKQAFGAIKAYCEKTTGRTVNLISQPEPKHLSAIEYRNFYANINAYKSATNWHPKITFEQGIALTVSHYLPE